MQSMKEIKNFVVLGAGAMGAQIAALAAESGFNVKVRDVEDKYIQRGKQIIEGNYNKRIQRGRFTEDARKQIMEHITFLTDLKEAVKDADYVIEAVPEILSLKQKVLGEASALSRDDTVFATNTSSLSISEIAEGAKHPERVVGTHYFNPPGSLILLEIVQGIKTSADTIAIADIVAKKMKREIIHVKDVPGFLVNRIWLMVANEAEWAVCQGEAKSMQEVDSAARFKMGLPMGLLEIDDILQGGAIDTRYHVMEHFRETLGESYRPSPLTENAYKAGHFGKRSGRGFYDWSSGQTNEIPMNAGANFDIIRILSNGVNECAKLLDSEATTKEEIDRGVIQGLNYPRGILRIADSIGIDNIVAELNRLYNNYHEERYITSPLLLKMVTDGKLGRKTGEGFYSYGPGEFEFVKVEINKESKIARLILNRTHRANALNLDFITEINKALDEMEGRNDIRCVVLTGSGANFCGGADVSSFAAGRINSVITFTEAGQNLSTRIETYSKPVIAAINGPAIGGGFEMALACDIRIMSKKAQLRLPELTIGLTPGLGGTQRLIRLIGSTRAKEIVLLADPVMAEKALEWGIVNFIAEDEKFEELVNEIAKKLAGGPPLAQKLAKAAFYYGHQADQRTGLFIEAAISGDLMFTKDLNEGLTALSYRRTAEFSGQ
jgi:enoyl-CoA hydratase / 3-hydroxyacyl-CoA dehydrogenase